MQRMFVVIAARINLSSLPTALAGLQLPAERRPEQARCCPRTLPDHLRGPVRRRGPAGGRHRQVQQHQDRADWINNSLKTVDQLIKKLLKN